MKPVLLDSGAIVALLDRDEKHHADCVAVLKNLRQPLVTCEAVITESCYLLRNVSGAVEAILHNVERGFFQVPLHLSQHANAVQSLLRKYRDIPADFADACLIHMADLLNSGTILTLDSDFYSYRWRRTHAFDLLISI